MSRRETSIDTLAACSGNTVYLWERSSLTVATLKHRTKVGCLAWNRNNKVIAAGCDDGDIQICYNGGSLMKVIKLGASLGAITCLDWSAGSKFLAAGTSTGQITLYDVKLEKPHSIVAEGSGGPVTSLQYHPNDKFMAASRLGGGLEMYNLQGALINSLSSPDNSAKYSVQTTQSENVVACGSAQGSVLVWDWKNGQLLEHYQNHHQGATNAIEFIPTKPSMLYSVGEDGFINLQDRRAGLGFVSRVEMGVALSSLSVREDYFNVAVGTKDGTVLLYDPRNMSKPLHRLEASPGHTVTGLHWQHCYQNIVTRSRISSSKSRTLAPAAAMAAKPLRAVDSEKKGMEGVGKKEPVLEPPPGTRIPVSIAQNATAGNPTYSAMRRHSGIGTGMTQAVTDLPPSRRYTPGMPDASVSSASQALHPDSNLHEEARAGVASASAIPGQHSAAGTTDHQGHQAALAKDTSVQQTPSQQQIPGKDTGLSITPLSSMLQRHGRTSQNAGQTPTHQVQQQQSVQKPGSNAVHVPSVGAASIHADGHSTPKARSATGPPAIELPDDSYAGEAATLAITPLSTMAPQRAPHLQPPPREGMGAAAQKLATPAHQTGEFNLSITPLSGMRPSRTSAVQQPDGVLQDSTNQRTLHRVREAEQHILQRLPLRRQSGGSDDISHRLPSPTTAGLGRTSPPHPTPAADLPSPKSSAVSAENLRGEGHRQGVQKVAVEDLAVSPISNKLARKQQVSPPVGSRGGCSPSNENSEEWHVKAAPAQLATSEIEASNLQGCVLSCPDSSSSLAAVDVAATPGFSFHTIAQHAPGSHSPAAAPGADHHHSEGQLGSSQELGSALVAQQQVQRASPGQELKMHSEAAGAKQHGLREDILALHLDMLNQFQVQQQHMTALVHHVVERQDLMAEEIRVLRKQLQNLVQTRDDLLWL